MRVPYHCTHSNNAFKDYYLNQAAFGLPAYAGSRHQRGHGFFSNLYRAAVPLLKKAGIGAAKHLLNTGANILSDIGSGQSLKESAKARFKETGKNILGSLSGVQSGTGRCTKRKRKIQSRAKKGTVKKQKAIKDFFSKK